MRRRRAVGKMQVEGPLLALLEIEICRYFLALAYVGGVWL